MVSDVRFARASAKLQASGLLGWASAQVGMLRVDGYSVRRTRAGEIRLFPPERVAANGTHHPVVRAINESAQHLLEEQILGVLRERGHVP